MMALKLYLWVLKWLGSSQKRILESKRLADVIFISPPVPKKNSWERCWWPYIRCSSPPAEHIKNHSKGKSCSLCAALTLLHPLSLVLTLPSLTSVLSPESAACWDGQFHTVSHGLPAHLVQELPRMGFLLLLLLSPPSSHQLSASERGFCFPSCLQAQEDQLPAALHPESHLHLG